MITKFNTITSEKEQNHTLEIETDKPDSVSLTIWNWTSYSDIELTPEQVERAVNQLGAWLAERIL